MHLALHGGLAFNYVKQSQQNLFNGLRAILFGAVILLTDSWRIYEIRQQLWFSLFGKQEALFIHNFGFFKIKFRFLRDKFGRSENLIFQILFVEI
jgi:hypothetical protein